MGGKPNVLSPYRIFSAYLSNKDSAYYYNYSFLVQQNYNFVDFLNKAVSKEKVLVDFFTRLKRLPQLKTMLGPVGGMELSLNIKRSSISF